MVSGSHPVIKESKAEKRSEVFYSLAEGDTRLLKNSEGDGDGEWIRRQTLLYSCK